MIESGLLISILRASIIAVFPLGLWAIGHFGSSKVWYFQTSTTSVIFGLARFWHFVAPFLGIAFLFMGISNFYLGQDPHSTSIWFYAGIACIPIGFICGFFQPAWLSPAWLRRLKREHKQVISMLLEDAVGMDKNTLRNKTKTWTDLEAWIIEVKQKQGLKK